MLTEATGLPSDQLRFMTIMNGKHYLIAGPGSSGQALLEYNSQTHETRTLLSDGGSPVDLAKVLTVLPDPNRQKLWLTVGWDPESKLGLYGLDCRTGLLSRQWPQEYIDPALKFCMPMQHWLQGNRLAIYCSSVQGVALANGESGDLTWLFLTNKARRPDQKTQVLPTRWSIDLQLEVSQFNPQMTVPVEHGFVTIGREPGLSSKLYYFPVEDHQALNLQRCILSKSPGISPDETSLHQPLELQIDQLKDASQICGMVATGDGLFIQTESHLYCLPEFPRKAEMDS